MTPVWCHLLLCSGNTNHSTILQWHTFLSHVDLWYFLFLQFLVLISRCSLYFCISFLRSVTKNLFCSPIRIPDLCQSIRSLIYCFSTVDIHLPLLWDHQKQKWSNSFSSFIHLSRVLVAFFIAHKHTLLQIWIVSSGGRVYRIKTSGDSAGCCRATSWTVRFRPLSGFMQQKRPARKTSEWIRSDLFAREKNTLYGWSQ